MLLSSKHSVEPFNISAEHQARGILKRIITISLLVMVCCLRVNAQLGAISGQVSYQQYYRDYRYAGGLTKLSIKTPVLDLRMRGNLISPRILMYTLFTSVRANYISTTGNDISYSGSQYSWNRYNLITRFFPFAPVKLTLSARENAYDLTSNTDYGSDYTANRQQEQRAELGVYQVSWLPTLSVSFVRNRSFSITGYPYDIVNQTLTFGASGATDTAGAYSLTAAMADFRDKPSGWYDRFFTAQFSATRTFSERHGINLGAEYQKYTGASILGFSVQYSGTPSAGLRLTTALGGSNTLTGNAQGRSASLTQSASLRLNENFTVGAGATGFISQTKVSIGGGGLTAIYRSWATSGNVQHRRTVEGIGIQNAFSLGYSEQMYQDRNFSLTTSLANTLTRSFGIYSLTGNYNISYARVRSFASYDVVDNTAGLIFGGTILEKIQTQSDLQYRDTRYPGENTQYRNQRTMHFTQRFNGSFSGYVPLNLSLSGSANWYLSGLIGHTYGWAFSMSSPSFFVRGLSVNYRYSRSFDPYYRREIPEHTGGLTYGWKSLLFNGRFRYTTFPIESREFQFNVTRPF